MRRLVTWVVASALLASGVLVIAGDVDARPVAPPVPERPDVVGPSRAPLPGGVTGLAALPSAAPAAGFEAGGGGLAGSTWGLFGDSADDSAVMRAAGVQVDLGAPGWNAGAQYAVFDAGTTTQLWPASGASASSIVPAGVLRNGGAYELAVTVGGVTTRRAFTVDASRAGTVAGARTTSVASVPVSVNTGQKMGVGLRFSSADVGVTADTGVIGRLTEGLPAGWSWSGVGADVWKVEVVEGSASLPGVERIVKVYGGGVLVLGCAPATAGVSVCDTAGGQLVGEGPRSVVRPDGSVVLTEQSVGQALTFDASGRVVRIAQPGTPPVVVTYSPTGGLDRVTWEVGSDPLVWDVFYPGDADCDDRALPSGFVTTPTGFVCGWTVPAGERTRLLYSAPAGGQPRISRIVQLPDCAASMVGCDPNLTEFRDFGWDASNRLAATRDTLTARATIAGLIAPTDATHWQATFYDAAGRMETAQDPTPVVDDRGRLASTAAVVTTTMAYATAGPDVAPATQQLAATTSGAGASLTTTTAVDDGGRVMAVRAAAGAVTRSVWAPYDDLLLATIYPNEQAETTVYDRWFRRIAKHTGPITAFGAACAPTAPQRGVTDPSTGNWTACAASAGTTRATSQLITFDEPDRVEAGLTAALFAPAATGLPSPFSGNPVGHAAADQSAGATPGIPIATVAPAASPGSGVRLDGGLLVPTSDGPAPSSWTLSIEAPSDLLTTGVVVVNGRVCALLDGGQGSCAVSPDGRGQHLTIDLELARAPSPADRVVLELQDPLGDPVIVDDSVLVRRWSTDTTLTKIDPVPAGVIPGWSDTTTTTHDYDCGAASASPAERVACIGSATEAVNDAGGLDITRAYTYEADGFGGVRLATATKPDGTGETTFTHWGIDDTAAGLPNADQLGALASVPQRGLPRTTTLPGGRSTTTVHDEYGTPVCQSVDGGNWTCTTLDVTRRPVTHVVRADTPGVAPVTIATDYAPAGNPLINRTTRTSQSRVTVTEQTTLAPSGRVLEYTDALRTTTAYGYDGVGRQSTTSITPPAVPGRAPRPRPPGAAQPAFTYASQFDPTSGLQTGITFQGQPLVDIAYDDTERPWLPTGYAYSLGAGTVSAAIDYDSDLNPFGRTWTLADSSTLLDCATSAIAPTACTAEIGDTQPGTTASGRMLARTVDGNAHRFTYDTARRLTGAAIGATQYGYGWDLNNNRTSRTVDGSTTTFTYNTADQLIATTDPEAQVGGFDADGNHASIGTEAYAYDALDQLVATSNTATGDRIDYGRDAQGRITSHTPTSGAPYFLSYSLPTDARPTLTMDASGAATPLLGLPGGFLYRGAAAAPLITDLQGNTLLALTVDGRRPTTDGAPVPVQQYDPFGEPTPGSTPAAPGTGPTFGWQQNQSDGPITHVGVRALHTRLGTFLQPDPRPHGSQAGPYSYTNADPVNQSDPTGLCVGWGCVKEADQFLQPIADAATLLACALGFGIACFVTSLIRVAISVLNFAADFELHQDAAYDGVTLALSFLNLAAATPLLWEARLISTTAQEFNLDRSIVQDAVALRNTSVPGVQAADIVFSGGITEENLTSRFLALDARFADLASWGTRATYLARGVSIVSVVGEYGARLTSGTLYNCCWKLW